MSKEDEHYRKIRFKKKHVFKAIVKLKYPICASLLQVLKLTVPSCVFPFHSLHLVTPEHHHLSSSLDCKSARNRFAAFFLCNVISLLSTVYLTLSWSPSVSSLPSIEQYVICKRLCPASYLCMTPHLSGCQITVEHNKWYTSSWEGGLHS